MDSFCLKKKPLVAALGAALAGTALSVSAADWSDTSLSWRYGTKFAEPFDNTATGGRVNITKNILALTHASGYKYGTNFFNVDLLMSDGKDPANCAGTFNCTGQAQEAYIVYRNTVDLGKVTGSDYKMGPVRGWGGTFGFDYNAKTDAGYNSKKRMLVAGPTAMFDVPGFLNVSVLELWESNAPCTTFPPAAVGFPASGCVNRYSYKTHPMLTGAWGIPLGGSGFSFEGFMNLIASKGTNEFGGPTKQETNFDGQIMYDMSRIGLGSKGTFKLGFEYQYWKNKFGNDASGPAGPGAFAKTPMIRAEYHF
ncbi:MAG: outer envelope protein [Betaproteobacteria bacterium]|nr:outer envelope protein [Betaproteobacteria bacterium]